MEEEVTQRTIALSIRTAKLTGNVLRAALRKFLAAQHQKGKNPYKQGKQTVKELIGQNAGVSNIEINDGKGSQQTTQEIEIYFNFVGRYLPPHFGEVHLTPEEEEEIRKREARKDRLHQNYLRRKENGKQKEYEDKVKEKKKAEIEAKKEAIRQEDIAKGVFVPVSMLPAAEPKKGVASV